VRSVSALLVDVPASHAAQIAKALPDVRTVPVRGEEALTAALARRGWDAVLHGGDSGHTKALALVRLADPHLPFIVVSPLGRIHGVPSVSTLTQLGPALTRELEQARMRRRVGGAHPCSAPSRRSPTTSRPAWTPSPCANACCRPSASRSAGPRAPSGAPRATAWSAPPPGTPPTRAPASRH
jgi:hypothetical protein